MPTVRVFRALDGTVRVMHLNERGRLSGETDTQFFARETEKQPELVVLPFVDMDAAALPTDRSKRYAWRLQAGRVVVDGAVPAPPDPAKIRRDAIVAATTLVDLKAALLLP